MYHNTYFVDEEMCVTMILTTEEGQIAMTHLRDDVLCSHQNHLCRICNSTIKLFSQ